MFIVGAVASAVIASALTAQVAVAAPTTVVDDTFDRTVSEGWGSASSGGAYGGAVPAGTMSVASGAGVLSLGANQGASVLLSQATATDARSDVTLRLDKLGAGAYYATMLRYQADGSHYRARLSINSAGVPFLALSRVNGTAETSVALVKLSTPMVLSAWYSLSFTLTGTSPVVVQASLTKVGESATAPQLNVTDSSDQRITQGGRVGWWGFVNSPGGTTVSLDRFTITDGSGTLASTAAAGSVPSATPTPTPTPTPTQTSAAPAAQPAAESAASAPARGSVTVGSASYAVPQGAIFVSNQSTQSVQNGAIDTPYKSVQAAVNAAKAGATIVIRGGQYNESVTVPSGKGLTIQAYPKEAVWFDGSVPVSAWSASGSTWVSSNWTPQFSSDLNNGQNYRFVNPSYPMAAHPDQLFIDGVAQKQVASAAQVTAGTFAVDYSSKRLIIGTNPSGKSVRASNLEQAFNVLAKNTTLQGFGVRRYATSFANSSAVRMQNTEATARDLVTVDNAMVGLGISNNNGVVERVTSERNGMMGFGANAAYNLQIRDSVFSNNNVEKFKDAPVSGGMKITRSRGIVIDNVTASDNTSVGMWFDESCYDIRVTRVTASNNTTTGIQLELSAKATVAGNQLFGNQYGIQIINSSDVRASNNDLGATTAQAVRITQDARRQSAPNAVGRDPRMGGVDPTVPWVVQNIAISNNTFGAGASTNIYALDTQTNRAVDTWNLSITGNVFTSTAGGTRMVAWGRGDNKTTDRYDTPEALAAAKNGGWKNVMTSSVKGFPDILSDASSHASIAVSTPSDLATWLGWAVGTKRIGSGL